MFADALVNPMYQSEVGVLCTTECVSTFPVEGGLRAVKFSLDKLYADRHRAVDEGADVMLVGLIVASCSRNAAKLQYGVRLA